MFVDLLIQCFTAGQRLKLLSTVIIVTGTEMNETTWTQVHSDFIAPA